VVKNLLKDEQKKLEEETQKNQNDNWVTKTYG
jgi:hypothetical protein